MVHFQTYNEQRQPSVQKKMAQPVSCRQQKLNKSELNSWNICTLLAHQQREDVLSNKQERGKLRGIPATNGVFMKGEMVKREADR